MASFSWLYRKMQEAFSLGIDEDFCTSLVRIEYFTQLKPGDHICMHGKHGSFNFRKRQVSFYKHHAIVKNIEQIDNSSGFLNMIHFTPTANDSSIFIQETKDKKDIRYDELFLVKYPHGTYPVDEILKRAESIVKIKDTIRYNLFHCNGKQFCQWCCIGSEDSLNGFQVEYVKTPENISTGTGGVPSINHLAEESDCTESILTVNLPEPRCSSDCPDSIVRAAMERDINRENNASSQDDEILESDIYGSITTTKPDMQGITDSDMYGSITTTKPNVHGISDSDMYGSITTTKPDVHGISDSDMYGSITTTKPDVHGISDSDMYGSITTTKPDVRGISDSDMYGYITTQTIGQGALYSSDEGDTLNDTFSIMLRCRRRKGGYSRSVQKARSRDEALTWRYMFINDTKFQEFKQRIITICDLVEISIGSNVVEIECANAKPKVIEEKFKKLVSLGTCDLKIKEFSIKMEESCKVVDVLKATRTDFSDKTVSVFIESTKCYLVCPAHVFENNIVALQKAHEFISSIN